MNRFSLLCLLSLGAFCLQGQTSSSITVSTSAPGARFQVDGTIYRAPASFNWPTGSEHILVFITDPPTSGETTSVVQTSLDGSTQYAFSGWTDNNSLVRRPQGL